MPVSQIFILSPRGDKLVYKDYRQDAPRNADEIFFRKYNFWDGAQHQAPPGDCPPFFTEKGVHFAFLRRKGVLFVCTSIGNFSPSLVGELLVRVVKVVRDFLGVLSEESIRRNFVLVYELLDEMIDVGIAQELNTERLRPVIFNEVVAVANPESTAGAAPSFLERIQRGEILDRTRRSDAAAASVVQAAGERKNEVYIDLIERLNVVFRYDGQIAAADVIGTITIKSFLAGSPTLSLGLNEDLVVGRADAARKRYASVVLDSVNFHEGVDYSRFETERLLSIRPPDGEVVFMNYRVTGESIQQPFHLISSIEVQSSFKAELHLRLRANIPVTTHGLQVSVRVPLPRATSSLGVELGSGGHNQTYGYNQEEKYALWNIEKVFGGTEILCKIRFSTSTPITAATRREVGPFSMTFEVPQHGVTGLGIRNLSIEERSSSYNPGRWVRAITQANSYVFRFH